MPMSRDSPPENVIHVSRISLAFRALGPSQHPEIQTHLGCSVGMHDFTRVGFR
jgi:hypothetical protein